MAKRITAFLLVAGWMLAMLFGCAKGGDSTPTVQATAPVETMTVGLCLRQYDQAPAYYDKIQAALESQGYKVMVSDGKNDQSRQDEQVQTLLADGCKLLVVEPVMVSALDTVISQAKTAGIPLLFMDREPEQAVLESYEKSCYIGSQSTAAGAAQARLLETVSMGGDINGDGVVSYVMLRGPEDHLDAQQISDGCTQALDPKKTRLLTTVYAQWELAAGRAACAGAISQFGPDIEVIFCNDTSLALGAAEAVRNRGWQPGQDMYVLAVGSSDDLQAAIDRGEIFGTVVPDIAAKCRAITDTAALLLSGQTPQQYTYIDYI